MKQKNLRDEKIEQNEKSMFFFKKTSLVSKKIGNSEIQMFTFEKRSKKGLKSQFLKKIKPNAISSQKQSKSSQNKKIENIYMELYVYFLKILKKC